MQTWTSVLDLWSEFLEDSYNLLNAKVAQDVVLYDRATYHTLLSVCGDVKYSGVVDWALVELCMWGICVTCIRTTTRIHMHFRNNYGQSTWVPSPTPVTKPPSFWASRNHWWFISFTSYLNHALQITQDLCWQLDSAFCMTQLLTHVLSLNSKKRCHVGICVMLGI